MKWAHSATSWAQGRLDKLRLESMLRECSGLHVLGILLFTLAGCHGSHRPFDRVFLDRNEAVELARQGMEAPQPDERRQAVARLAESRWVGDPEIVRTLGLIATRDHSSTVRTVAVVALGRAETPEACAASVALLPEEDTPRDRLPAESVRTEALKNLDRCVKLDLLSPSEVDTVRLGAMRMLSSDLSRNVRLASARLLGYFPQREVLTALVNALEQRDFGICHEAERSLNRLTGQSFDHDPVAWRAYLLQTSQPFAVTASSHEQADDDTGWFDWLKPKSKQ